MVPGKTETISPSAQYQHSRTVGGTIRIQYTGNDSRTSQALNNAIANFNNLNLSATLLRVADNYHPFLLNRYDGRVIKVYDRDLGNETLGRAGFPFWDPNIRRRLRTGVNVRVYPSVQINTRFINNDADRWEHVMTHEIGHCLGLRHTDYFNRRLSCGPNETNPVEASNGVRHIPGTPSTTNVDNISIMNACVRQNTNGEFSNYDVIEDTFGSFSEIT